MRGRLAAERVERRRAERGGVERLHCDGGEEIFDENEADGVVVVCW